MSRTPLGNVSTALLHRRQFYVTVVAQIRAKVKTLKAKYTQVKLRNDYWRFEACMKFLYDEPLEPGNGEDVLL